MRIVSRVLLALLAGSALTLVGCTLYINSGDDASGGGHGPHGGPGPGPGSGGPGAPDATPYTQDAGVDLDGGGYLPDADVGSGCWWCGSPDAGYAPDAGVGSGSGSGSGCSH